ncbi:MAG: phosphoribosylanthranilate isomerase [Bacteroidales bacterium]|nr:phosphoribosylanthranilate isomerase [Bacteroidales bacterium]MCD8395444.1 phosphoribosylanthranilate isomerase [Bacteroidales bacterium]
MNSIPSNNNPRPRHSDMVIKVCGNRYPDNIRDVGALAPMLMGFIFYDASPRSAIGLDPQAVKDLPEYIRPVAVFVNATTDDIHATCQRYGIHYVQLHGDESAEQCQTLKDLGYSVLKAIGVDKTTNWESLKPYEGVVDAFVFDTKTKSRGGSGRKFRWQSLENYSLSTPYLLSGGIGPDDVDAIVEAMRPGMAGIDVNSRFESAPGRKNVLQLANFILSLRKFNENESTSKPLWEKK